MDFIEGNPFIISQNHEEGLNRERWARLNDFVMEHGGTRVIQRILIANNGLAAVKGIRSMRRWAFGVFGDEHLLKFIAMATIEDINANSDFIRLADEIVAVPGGSNNMNYANVSLIIDVATRSKVDAVWPGWGHASECPKLSEGLVKRGIAFIGPSTTAMQMLGDKISSMLVAQTAQVPCMTWSGSGITLNIPNGKLDCVPEDVYKEACVSCIKDGLKSANSIGFPLMIKASEGGGGKGIRRVECEAEFSSAFDSVQREVPGSPIFLMKLASSARHLEVQIVADEYGDAISIYSRDCSVQRRHQKIIEEAPVTIVPNPQRWLQMEEAAVRLAKMVGYTNAGTVEFLYDTEQDEFSFLELNPRLQVEHPCSEMVSGINLPATQLQIAMGIPLRKIEEILQCFPPSLVDGEVELSNLEKMPPKGHVIACRITAENPDVGFKPSGGKLTDINFQSAPNVWGYFSISPSSSVHEYADSQFGHLFAHGLTRGEAINSMIFALKELSIRADFRNSSEYLIKLLERPEFLANTHSTSWLDCLIKEKYGLSNIDALTAVIAGACWHGTNTFEEREGAAKEMMMRGQVPADEYFLKTVDVAFVYNKTQYSLKVDKIDGDLFRLELNQSHIEIAFNNLADGSLLLKSPNHRNIRVYGKEIAEGVRLTVNGTTIILENESDPTVARSPSPGKLVRYLVPDGAEVLSGALIAEIEVMKMYMSIAVAEAGLVTLTRAPGTSLEAGDVIARVSLNNPSSVQRALPSQASFSPIQTQITDSMGTDIPVHKLAETSLRIIQRYIHNGYPSAHETLNDAMNSLFTSCLNAGLPFSLLTDHLANYESRLPKDILLGIRPLISRTSDEESLHCLREITDILQSQIESCDARDAHSYVTLLCAIRPHLQGPKQYCEHLISRQLEQLVADCLVFDGLPIGDALLQRVKETNNGGPEECFRLFCFYRNLDQISPFVSRLIMKSVTELQDSINVKGPLLSILRKITRLTNKCFSRLVQGAREGLTYYNLPSIASLRTEMEEKFKLFNPEQGKSFINEFVSGFSFHIDVLPSFFLHGSEGIRSLAMEIYIRRIFEAFEFLETKQNGPFLAWTVAAPPPVLVGKTSKHSDCNGTFERRAGAFACFKSQKDAFDGFGKLIESLAPEAATKNLIYVAVPSKCDLVKNEKLLISEWETMLSEYRALLHQHRIQRVAVLAVNPASAGVSYYTFRELLGWHEDGQVRNVEPAMSYLLELPRLSQNYKIKLLHADPTGQIHIYMGEAPNCPPRLFARIIIRPKQRMRGHETLSALILDSKSLFSEVLDCLAMAQSQMPKPLDCNHLFISVLTTFRADPRAASGLFLSLMDEFEEKLLKLRVMEGEIKLNLQFNKSDPVERFRFFLWNETGFVHRIAAYKEVGDTEDGPAVLCCLEGTGLLHGTPVCAPHPLVSEIQRKRIQANALETSYVYDFPAIFQLASQLEWSKFGKNAPADCLESYELILSEGTLKEIKREPGLNDTGMVAWKMVLRTPFHPSGRTIIVIANDIIHEIGSFGLTEDYLFAAASTLARRNKWPVIFLGANSGARIGLAEPLRELIKPMWIDVSTPSKGFEYLYLDPSDHSAVSGLVKTLYISEHNHYRIIDIIGGLGVENLSGSGMIAREMSLAYSETFTATFVTGRSVGIGAYLTRLSQRVIQKQNQPIILTGVQALNQILGRDVYRSNLQIGGPQIMAHNGLSHKIVRNDLEGVQSVICWLEFVSSADAGLSLQPIEPPLVLTDDPERMVTYTPPENTPYDPRLLVNGAKCMSGTRDYGLLDQGSFIEYQEAWARSVVVGRGRLGGLAVAVLMVETRTTESLIPADPAMPNSESTVISQAGQVWYPDSAFKTAQFIQDCNNGEGLPLIILANWRGFSGGQRDLFDEILKFGSYIVDALREYEHPVFVYLPPHAQLRGGSWVVVDSAINPRNIEMYADPSARGGIIEPEGLVAIKFKSHHLSSLATRLLPEASNLEFEMFEPIAHRIACTFADLHDRPGRMKELDVIRAIIPWAESRRFLYHRLRLRLWLIKLHKKAISLSEVESRVAREKLDDELKTILYEEWLPAFGVDPSTAPDQVIVDTLNRHYDTIEVKLNEWCSSRLASTIASIALGKLSLDDRLDLCNKLSTHFFITPKR